MELQFQQIPAVLKARRQWVLWRYESRDGKPTKVPYATTGERASATDGATWATYDAAVAALVERADAVDGIGFVFTSEDPFVGIDLDNCRDPGSGKIEPWAGAIIRRLKSYTEITPSGCGVHILCQGELPPGPRRKGPIEMYSAARYFTITGRRLGHIAEVEERRDELVAVHQETFAEPPPKVNGDHPPTLADHEIVMRVTKEPGYQSLWSGDFSRYPSQSEADLALCGRIAFFAGPDPSTIDRLFRQSGLMREKWDSVHHGRSGSTYGADTIQRALSSMVAFYGWKEGAARKAGAAPPAGPGPAAERDDGPDPIHRTDLGNAALLVRRFGADLHWTGERGWLVWDGVRWREDKTEQVEGMACTIARLLFEEGCAQTGDEREAGIKWALRSEGRARIEAMTELAKSQPGIPISAGEFDRDPELAGHPSGKLCLGPQPAVLPSSRADRITHSIGCVVDPAAACPRWEQFLNEVMDGQTELVEFLQRAAGYSLTGHVSEQCLFFLHGAGENGKSTLLSTLLALFGEYGMVAPPGLLLERYRDQHPTEIADLAGKRLVVSEEVGEGKRLAEELVKRLTGGLPMKGRWMNRDFFQFRPEFKLWLAANHKPEVRGTDHAIWRRIYLIPFTVRFGSLDAPPKDPRLADTLAAELPGILNWVLAGVERWQAQGLAPPDAVRAATDEYRNEMDTLGGFFAECCFLKESAQCRGGQIYEAYGAWCLRSGERPVSSKEFAQRLRERGFKSRHGHYGSVWDGIGVKEGGERAENGLFG